MTFFLRTLVFAVVWFAPVFACSTQREASLFERLDKSLASAPNEVEDCTPQVANSLDSEASALESTAGHLVWSGKQRDFPTMLALTKDLLHVNREIDEKLDEVLSLRFEFSTQAASAQRRAAMRNYLRISTRMISLSSQLRSLERDLINGSAFVASSKEENRSELIQVLIDHRSSMGATMMSVLLVDPPPESHGRRAQHETKMLVLRLIKTSGTRGILPQIARCLEQDNSPGNLVVSAADAIRQMGLPQQPRPGEKNAKYTPSPTAEQLKKALLAVEDSTLNAEFRRQRNDLLKWLNHRIEHGVLTETFRLGGFDVRAGDWLLMRNPSPYNLFTDLSPGLFTHVGVVTTETGSDGIRRFVIVDLPERGTHIPSTNVDQYLKRTLHFFFLRHRDMRVGKQMGDVARNVIGNETEFDLTFRTDRVLELKGQDLRGKRINTYCAGFLMLCAQETSAPMNSFFPIRERAAPGHTLANLEKLGLSVGDDFLSPTGAIFSPELNVVAKQQPLYDPTRVIKEAIYDHFAWSMQHRILTPAPSLYQSLRVRLAKISQGNSLLTRLLAQANNVSEHIDLVSAAKAAAVVETLDAIGDENMKQYLESFQAFLARPHLAGSHTAQRSQKFQGYREQHRELYEKWTERLLTARDLQQQLVDFYIVRGKNQLDERFFSDELLPPE